MAFVGHKKFGTIKEGNVAIDDVELRNCEFPRKSNKDAIFCPKLSIPCLPWLCFQNGLVWICLVVEA